MESKNYIDILYCRCGIIAAMIRSILLAMAILVTVPYCGAAQQTIIQKLFTDSTGTGTSSAINNQGQSQHALFIIYSNTGGTCTTIQATGVVIQGSFDGLNYITISPFTLGLVSMGSGTYTGYTQATGLFPFLRGAILNGPNPNCKVNVWYSGTIQTNSFPQVYNSNYTGYHTDGVLFNTAASGIAIAIAQSSSKITIYGLWLQNGAATDNTVEMFEGPAGGGCASSVNYVFRATTLVGKTGVISWPTSSVPYYISTNPNSNICLSLTAATQVNMTVTYRYE